MDKLLNGLYLVPTPIGNLDDITLRAINILKKSDIILCEDTRHSIKLFNHFKIKNKLVALHKFNERSIIKKVIKYLEQGKILSLISDSGTPTLSDPGKILVQECIKKEFNIIPLPGPSSITAAFSASGFDDKFIFYGFLPKKKVELEKKIVPLSKLDFSLIFFAPSNKVNFYLDFFKKNFHDREIMIAKEISKIFEKFFRGKLSEIKFFEKDLKGELTIVISKKLAVDKIDLGEIRKKIKKYLPNNSVKDTVKIILSEDEKLSKSLIYKMCLELKK